MSPQTKGSNINIQFAEDQKDFNGEIGLHANSNIATVNLPQSDIPLNLFNNEESRITFGIDQFKEAVPVSLQKLTISDGGLHFDVPDGMIGIEFKEVETFSSGKIQTYQKEELLETLIGPLKMNHGSSIEVHNVSFNNSITMRKNSNISIQKEARFNEETIISLIDSSFIDFGDSLIEGICQKIVIQNDDQNATNLEEDGDNETFNAQIICGTNFDCSSWKEKYSLNYAKYPYAKCTEEEQNRKCLVASNKIENVPKKKKGLSKGAIIGIVVACIAVILIIIIEFIVFAVKKRNKIHFSSGEEDVSVGL